MNFQRLIVLALFATSAFLGTTRAEERTPLSNPFFAMDTAYHNRGLSRGQELDLVKKLGFDGVSEDIRPAAQTKNQLDEIESRGLKLYAVYAPAKVTADGKLSRPDDLPGVMDALKNHGCIIWLHIGGAGPEFAKLTGNEPMIATLRHLAELAKIDGLRIAIYPHIGEYTSRFGNALKLAKLVNHDSFGVTFNLCHCLATGDEDEIPSLVSAAGPALFCATIDGADTGVKGGDWSRLIQPLGSGSFDPRIVLDALQSIHYTGPIGFQGYGIKGSPQTILEPTITAWKTLSGEK